MQISAALQLAVRLDDAGQRFRRHAQCDLGGKCGAERGKILAQKTQSRGHRMSAELLDQFRMAGRDAVERVANVHAGDAARRAAQGPVLGERERDHGPMQTVLDAPGDQADDALVPGLVEQAQAEGLRLRRPASRPRPRYRPLRPACAVRFRAAPR
jgi:hypothetical protein